MNSALEDFATAICIKPNASPSVYNARAGFYEKRGTMKQHWQTILRRWNTEIVILAT